MVTLPLIFLPLYLAVSVDREKFTILLKCSIGLSFISFDTCPINDKLEEIYPQTAKSPSVF
jgi:hypothetical protein